MTADEYDYDGNWLGTCRDCHTSHEGEGPNTIAGRIKCMESVALRLTELGYPDDAKPFLELRDQMNDSIRRATELLLEITR